MNDGAEKTPTDPLDVVGRYRIRAEIASGGMATVYLAQLFGPHGFEKLVAIKRIHPHLTKDRRFVEMFLDEARVTGSIQHPNVCAILDFGEERGAPYLVMEYLHGESFGAVIRGVRAAGKELPLWFTARVIHDAARGLHAAHELAGPDGLPLGVVHRDVSPDNLFVLYDGVTKVVDFGVARARNRLTVTRTNEVKGKLPYMSPEQFGEEKIDRRTDLWALGVVLWEATTGARLFRADNDGATIARVLSRPIPRPSEVVAGYPAALEAIVMRCLERDRARRYATAEELADDLERFLYGLGVPSGSTQVKRFLTETFAARIEERDAMLRGEIALEPLLVEEGSLSSIRARADAEEPTRAAAPSSSKAREEVADAPTRAGRPSAVHDEDLVPTRALAQNVPSHGRRRPRALAIGLAGLVLVAAGLVAWLRAGDDASEGPARGAIASAPPAPGSDVPVALPPAEPRAATPAPPAAVPAPEAAPVVVPSAPAVAPSAIVDATRDRAREAARLSTAHESTEAARRATTVPAETRATPPVPVPTAVRARETPPASTPSLPGRLSLLAIPAASVTIDGRAVGDTPRIVELAPGPHRVELVTADGRRQSIAVTIASGETTRRRVEFE